MEPGTIDIAIDKHAVEPIYQQLARSLRAQIESGRLAPGERLPATRDLAQALGIGRISVVNAYAQLRSEGLIAAHAGRGTYVTGARPGGRGTSAGGGSAGLAQYLSAREMTRLAQQPGVIAFNSGAPPEEFLPVEALRRAINTVLDRDATAAVDYEDAEGYLPLRVSVTEYVTSLGIQCSPDEVLITGGAQQALDLVVQSLLKDGEALITSNPTYLGILDIAHVRRIVPIGVPMDHEGLRLEALEAALQERRAGLIYVDPTYHNPTGTVMPLHRRRRLLALAARYNVPVLEDGVYHEMSYYSTPPAPLKALDEHGLVIHASGFSKILLPGTRIGYVLAAGALRDRLARIKEAADICTPGLNQRAMQVYLASGALTGHLNRVRSELRARCEAACEAAHRWLPAGSSWEQPGGGMYLWVRLPDEGPSAADLYLTAIRHGVAYAVGTLFHTDGAGERYLRINFGAHPPARIAEGFRRLNAAWSTWQEERAAPVRRAPIL